jgi:hypothetical protein
MATTRKPEHESRNAGQASRETAEATKTAADAAQRTIRAAADAAESMAETMAESLDAETFAATTRESLAVATRTQQQAVASMERSSSSMLTGLTEMQKEIAEFVSERIRQDLETQQDLLRCRTLDDVREVQSRFFRTTIDQYSAEVTKLMQISAEVFTRSLDLSRTDVRAAGH